MSRCLNTEEGADSACTRSETFANLPGGDFRLRNQQERIRSRLHDLQSMSQIKRELASTHLESEEERKVKKEEDERDGREQMEGVVEDGAAEEATSPSAKRRIAAQVIVRIPLPAGSERLPLTVLSFSPVRQTRSPSKNRSLYSAKRPNAIAKPPSDANRRWSSMRSGPRRRASC